MRKVYQSNNRHPLFSWRPLKGRGNFLCSTYFDLGIFRFWALCSYAVSSLAYSYVSNHRRYSMFRKTKPLTMFLVSMVAIAFLASAISQVQAKPKVRVKFATSGLSNLSNGITVLTIDGVSYDYWGVQQTNFNWEIDSTHTVLATTSLTGWDGVGYQFSSWTNGNGLVGASGTFTVPSSDLTVTANYVQSTVHVRFAHSGLSNLNNNVVLTIDGVGYTYWTVPQTDFQWAKGSTHTVTAANSLTGWDGVTHWFSSWTNGNGLTGPSGTFTVPNTDATVTVNYALQQPMAETSLTITCTPTTVDKGGEEIAMISGYLTSEGSGIGGKTISLAYFDGSNWQSIASVTTASDGSYSYDWDVPETILNGQYPVKAEFAGEGCYLGSTAITGSTGNGTHLMVVPENELGSVVALLAVLAAVLLFFKLRVKRR